MKNRLKKLVGSILFSGLLLTIGTVLTSNKETLETKADGYEPFVQEISYGAGNLPRISENPESEAITDYSFGYYKDFNLAFNLHFTEENEGQIRLNYNYSEIPTPQIVLSTYDSEFYEGSLRSISFSGVDVAKYFGSPFQFSHTSTFTGNISFMPRGNEIVYTFVSAGRNQDSYSIGFEIDTAICSYFEFEAIYVEYANESEANLLCSDASLTDELEDSVPTVPGSVFEYVYGPGYLNGINISSYGFYRESSTGDYVMGSNSSLTFSNLYDINNIIVCLDDPSDIDKLTYPDCESSEPEEDPRLTKITDSYNGSYYEIIGDFDQYNYTQNYLNIENNTGFPIKIRQIYIVFYHYTSAFEAAHYGALCISDFLDGKCGAEGSFNVSEITWSNLNENLDSVLGCGDIELAKMYLREATRLELSFMDSIPFALIQNMMAHYDNCVEKFGYEPLPGITNVEPYERHKIGISNIFGNSENGIAAMVIIALAAVTGLGALLYIRKRKENH